MSDFPRGWTLTNDAPAGVASITVAAVAGVVHVLDGFSAMLNWFGGAPAAELTSITLTSSDGVFAALVIGRFGVEGVAGASGMDSASGLDLAAGPGASLTIAFNLGAVAGLDQYLRVQGHDI